MIVLIGATKGGNGKSVLSCNLAARRSLDGHDVLLLDGDRQGSSSLWAELRGELKPHITCMQKFGKGLQKEIRALADKSAGGPHRLRGRADGRHDRGFLHGRGARGRSSSTKPVTCSRAATTRSATAERRIRLSATPPSWLPLLA